MRILLVDDDRSMCRLIDAMLVKMGHEVVHANDGLEAWALLQRDDINFVLSDWCMPRMDGVELCRKVRARGNSHYTYLVLLTGNTDENDMIIAMQAGADDFLTKPVKASELEVRIEAGLRVLALEESLINKNLELEQTYRILKDKQHRIQRDLEAAAAIQQGLLPEKPIAHFPLNFAWDLMPADEVAGDLFNFFPLDDHHLGFYLVDVSGHGIPAAMLSMYIAKSLSAEPCADSVVKLSKSEMQQKGTKQRFFPFAFPFGWNCQENEIKTDYREPREVAQRLNSYFEDEQDGMLYFTMIYGVLDTRNGKGKLCQAGHPYPIISRADGSIEKLGSGGYPIGLIPDASYDQIDFQLYPGDRLLVYSDGITECRNTVRNEFGEQRLAQCLSRCRSFPLKQTLQMVKDRLSEWNNPLNPDAGLQDDASMLALEMT